jgi:hypothetical protein
MGIADHIAAPCTGPVNSDPLLPVGDIGGTKTDPAVVPGAGDPRQRLAQRRYPARCSGPRPQPQGWYFFAISHEPGDPASWTEGTVYLLPRDPFGRQAGEEWPSEVPCGPSPGCV